MNKEDRRRIAEIKNMNEELRKNAPIPEGEHDIKGYRFENYHNRIEMTIVSSWVGDTGVVIWTSDAGDLYTTREIKQHWMMLDEEPQGW